MQNKPPIAVVGMAGIFPGAVDLDTFWQNLVQKKSTAAPVPADRWIIPPEAARKDDYTPDKAVSIRACLADPPFLNSTGLHIDPALLEELDPLYHLVLGAGREAFSASNLSSVDKNRIGVSLAAIALPTDASSALARSVLGRSFEQQLMAELGSKVEQPPFHWSRAQALSSRVTSLPGAILAKALGLGGGSFTLDAACASSLYAVKLACDELQSGRADAMLSGGVSRPDCLYTQIGFSQLRALSPTGRCAPFDASADGLVVGEGVGILVLKRLKDALAQGDRVYALIRGIGLSNDMRGNLLAPDTEGQVRAMRAAYDAAGWSPEDADLIECHGAGTPVGDKTELTSLRTLWGESRRPTGGCPIGSVKSHIGHLLTGAGAAGMIKTLMGMQHRVFPPSLNFSRPAENSPLIDSPFRVQTEPEEWRRRSKETPRRAGVSAFGFGGINAHLLFEEWDGRPPDAEMSVAVSGPLSTSGDPETRGPIPVAIVGMGSAFGACKDLRDFQEAVFQGNLFIRKRPTRRWRGADEIAETAMGRNGGWGGYMDSLSITPGEFRVPPNEIPDILPQQLLMLKVAADALKDAGLPLREYRPRMGTAVGMEFDLEATRFQLRWNLFNEVQRWAGVLGMGEEDAGRWLEALRDACGPPLTAARVLGSLGGIVASRVAREFRFGGPGFVVSADAASGIKALEIGLRSLQQGETDTFLAGAVDLTGDVLNMIALDAIRPFSADRAIHPFDRRADGSLPGEGAAALVLKRLDQAETDGDRIYAVIRGIGKASGDFDEFRPEIYLRSFEGSLKEAGIKASGISYVETHGSGDPGEDRIESEALHAAFSNGDGRPAVGSLKPVFGDTGAVSGLASVVKAGICLYHHILPPLPNYAAPTNDIWRKECFHIPAFPQFWLRDHRDGPRRACVGSITRDGNCAHVILEEAPAAVDDAVAARITRERRRPLGPHPAGLFVVEGDSPEELLQGLEALKENTEGAGDLETAARSWHEQNRDRISHKGRAVAIVAKDSRQLPRWIADARKAVMSGIPKKIVGPGGIAYFPEPLAPDGEIAFVYPGSGNHYVGMGRGIGVRWPSILRRMDTDTHSLKTQMIPEVYTPWRVSWEPGWEQEAHEKIISDPLYMLFGQVIHGGVMTRLVNEFGVFPNAVIGYSLGESAGYFATGAWSGRNRMLQRMRETDLFSTQLAGPCTAARQAWHLPPEEPVDWRVAVINRPAERVRKVLPNWPLARLLIINTPDECVIGGQGDHVRGLIGQLGCDPIFLDGVVTVHCDAAVPAADAYRELHLFPTHPPESIRYYSCALGRSQKLTRDSAADSILKQALHGFDFPATVERAYADGVRIFLEMGPQSSCTRMIQRILGDRPHSALSACVRGEDDYLTVLKFLGNLIAERVPVDIGKLYGPDAFPPATATRQTAENQNAITLAIGADPPSPPPPPAAQRKTEEPPDHPRPSPEKMVSKETKGSFQPSGFQNTPSHSPEFARFSVPESQPSDGGRFEESVEADRSISDPEPSPDGFFNPFEGLAGSMTENIETNAAVHRQFLEFSDEMSRHFSRTFSIQNELLGQMISGGYSENIGERNESPAPPASEPPPAFPREMCLEFAIGSAAKVLGPEFTEVDGYRARVRLPDEPLMLVDRILAVEGEKASLGPGRVVTEHDVLPGAWYLDGDRAPVCISVEAGQADLFLCSYLGIDLKVKGKRTYRLLDAKAGFHRGLPRPGETIRYEIEIDRFVKSGDTYMFFFHFEGYIGDEHLITMRDGCAGFFTEEEVRNSGGIILTEAEKHPQPGFKDFPDLVPTPGVESYEDAAVEALRAGDLARCFGPDFAGITVPESLRLPGGRMRLLDRVLHLDPQGGRYGLGMIRAEADIHPDDWFLTCHFVDDRVMPGTLMYECCNHTLRVLLQRMGWVVDKPEACYEPVIGMESVLKCRGPVTPDTRRVIYEVEIKEMGFNPEPYVIADAMMYGDGHKIVRFTGMSVKMTGVSRKELVSFWSTRNRTRSGSINIQDRSSSPLYTREQILAFAVGNPSEAFGDRYKPFDHDRFIARLPGPPYFFMDRIVSAEPDPWVLKPDGWVEAEYDVPPDAWYFRADRSGTMPFCVLLEIPLQACGWTAAYLGSALRSDSDLKFRNLGGKAVLHRPIGPDAGRLTMRVRLTQVSQAGGMIIQNYDMGIWKQGETLYEGVTTFGFFSPKALAQQVGIQGAGEAAYHPSEEEIARGRSHVFTDEAPLTPYDSGLDPAPALAMPAKAFRMIDRVDLFVPDGGPNGLGFIRGSKTVDPNEWFFAAHFYQDPVCPGSLGIESFLQLLKFAARQRWKHRRETHRFEMLTEDAHSWIYRGQIIRTNKKVEVEAVITRIENGDSPTLWADGYLKVDGLYIYQMDNFAIRLVPIRSAG
ncbi:MAG: beta-ketoacyl synthase N-terminal-like domain-containing protein [Thermodesulfobacteriota bacterium]